MEIYDLLIPEDYQSADDGQKTKFYQAGVAFKNDKSEGFTLKIPEGMSLSGKVLMMKRKDKSES